MSSSEDTLGTSSFWLVPCASQRDFFDSIVKDLAQEFSTPVFCPHLTLHCVFQPASVRSALVPALDRAVQKLPRPISLKVASIGHSALRFKTLFVEFEGANEDLFGLARSLSAELPSDYMFAPHLSLLYRENLDLKTRERLAKMYAERLRGLTVEFNSVTLVSPGKGHDTFDFVEDWEIVEERPLD